MLEHYINVLDQFVNYHKSKVQFLDGVQKQVCKEVTDILNIAQSNNVGTYLECSIYIKKGPDLL